MRMLDGCMAAHLLQTPSPRLDVHLPARYSTRLSSYTYTLTRMQFTHGHAGHAMRLNVHLLLALRNPRVNSH